MNWCRDLVYCDALLHTDPNLYCTQQDTGLQYYSIILYYTVSVLGRDEGYTAKFGLSPREFQRAQYQQKCPKTKTCPQTKKKPRVNKLYFGFKVLNPEDETFCSRPVDTLFLWHLWPQRGYQLTVSKSPSFLDLRL